MGDIMTQDTMLGFFNRLGITEILVILLALLLLFGGKKLPELAKGLARGLREFKEELSGSGAKKDQAAGSEQKPDEKDKS
jgi:sec-independent protein translocase protein TatA